VFVWNNWTDEVVDKLKGEERFTYILFGKEHGKEGTPHLQGYFELAKKRTKSSIRKLIPVLQHCWLQVARGTAKQNHVYSGKEDKDPYERGVPTKQGQRADLTEVKRRIDDGETNEELWDTCFHTMVRYHRSFAVYKKIKAPKRNWVCNVILIVGDTDTGKSHLANIMCRSGAFGNYFKCARPKGSGLYFDGYDGEPCVFIDEMDGSFCKPPFLNELTDRYEMSVPIHCAANVAFLASTIIICSNYMPKDWWAPHHNIAPFMRRITLTHFMRKPWGSNRYTYKRTMSKAKLRVLGLEPITMLWQSRRSLEAAEKACEQDRTKGKEERSSFLL